MASYGDATGAPWQPLGGYVRAIGRDARAMRDLWDGYWDDVRKLWAAPIWGCRLRFLGAKLSASRLKSAYARERSTPDQHFA